MVIRKSVSLVVLALVVKRYTNTQENKANLLMKQQYSLSEDEIIRDWP